MSDETDLLRVEIRALRAQLAAALKGRDEWREEFRLQIGAAKALIAQAHEERDRLAAALEPTAENLGWMVDELERGQAATPESYCRAVLAAIRARSGLPEAPP